MVQQIGCHIMSSNGFQHYPYLVELRCTTPHTWLPHLSKRACLKFSVLTTSASVPASTGTTAPFPPPRYVMTPLRPRRAQAGVLIANACGTAVRPLIVHVTRRRGVICHTMSSWGLLAVVAWPKSWFRRGGHFVRLSAARNDLLGARMRKTRTFQLAVETRVPLRR